MIIFSMETIFCCLFWKGTEWFGWKGKKLSEGKSCGSKEHIKEMKIVAWFK